MPGYSSKQGPLDHSTANSYNISDIAGVAELADAADLKF